MSKDEVKLASAADAAKTTERAARPAAMKKKRIVKKTKNRIVEKRSIWTIMKVDGSH